MSIPVPKNIFQTWNTKNLPPKMKEQVESLRNDNKEFHYYLYDDNDCRMFIKNYFNSDILEAYDTLIPGAYKADLWRYCVLYKYGGIYLDIKFKTINGFKLIDLLDNNYYVRDIKIGMGTLGPDGVNGVYNAFMVSKPQNPILLSCIISIVKHVKERYYGYNQLCVTGPALLAEFFTDDEINNFPLNHDGKTILYNNKSILEHYPEYREEQKKTQKIPHYDSSWKTGEIYHPPQIVQPPPQKKQTINMKLLF